MPGNRALRSGNDVPTSTDRAEIGQYKVIIVTTHLLVKIEGGAKIGTAPAFVKIRSQIT